MAVRYALAAAVVVTIVAAGLLEERCAGRIIEGLVVGSAGGIESGHDGGVLARTVMEGEGFGRQLRRPRGL